MQFFRFADGTKGQLIWPAFRMNRMKLSHSGQGWLKHVEPRWNMLELLNCTSGRM